MTLKFPRIRKMHQSIRELQLSEPRRHNRYVSFQPASVFYMDQVLLALVVDEKCTFEARGSKRVWVAQPGEGLDNSQATLQQLCIRSFETHSVKPAIVFRGLGKRIASSEKAQYASGVKLYFQKLRKMLGWMRMLTYSG